MMQSSKSTNRPATDDFSGSPLGAHSSRITSMYSSMRAPRSLNGTPSAENSSASHPTPTPSVTRPPERWSSVAISFAVTTTLRCGSTSTPVARRIVSVRAATNVSQISGSGRSNTSAPPAIFPLGSYGYCDS